jgi:hypothetical protein
VTEGYDPLLLGALDALLSAEGDAPGLESVPEQAAVFESSNGPHQTFIYRRSSLPLLRNLLIEIDRQADAWRNGNMARQEEKPKGA